MPSGSSCASERHAPGTEIIGELGDEHVRSGKPICCYTSADSVFQIAAHEETFKLERLYSVCQTCPRAFGTAEHRPRHRAPIQELVVRVRPKPQPARLFGAASGADHP
jgi:phosphopentomutase